MTKRIQYFDILKGIAIYLVVMGHVLTMCIRDIDSAFVFKLISHVHMPIFFFISGYLTYKTEFIKPNIKKRFKQLIIPFLIVSTLWIWYFPHSNLQSPFDSSFSGLYFNEWKNGYWFTLTLFEIFVIYYIISLLIHSIKKPFAQFVIPVFCYVIIIACNFLLPQDITDLIGLSLLTTFFPIFMIGIFANKYNTIYKTITRGNYWYMIGLAIFIICFYYLAYIWEFPWIPTWITFIAQPLEHIGLIIVLVTLITPWITKEYSNGKEGSIVTRYFSYLGKESLSIYLLHYFFLFPLTPLQEPLRMLGLSIVPLTIVSSITAFLIITIVLFASHIIKQNSTLSMLIVGK